MAPFRVPIRWQTACVLSRYNLAHMVEDQPLGEAAVKYMRETLAAGDRLACRLLETQLGRGQLHAYLPKEIDGERITNFAADVFWGRELNPDDDWRASSLNFVLSYLTAAPTNLAVWEGWPEKLESEPSWKEEINHFWDYDGIWTVWGDSGNTRSDSRTSYMYLMSPTNQDCIAKLFRKARAYPAVCVLTELTIEVTFPPPTSVAHASLLANLAEHAAHILVGAFDEGGFVIWSRS